VSVIDMEGRWADLGQFIRAQRDAAQMSVRRLAETAGVSNPYLSQIERGLRKPSAEILQQLARALRISVETLYVHAGILDRDDEPQATVIEAIVSDERLTAEQRHTLITVYESFLAQHVGPVDGTPAPNPAAAPVAAPTPTVSPSKVAPPKVAPPKVAPPKVAPPRTGRSTRTAGESGRTGRG
jgi:transcriptional regulator with XRE-family HTH domain